MFVILRPAIRGYPVAVGRRSPLARAQQKGVERAARNRVTPHDVPGCINAKEKRTARVGEKNPIELASAQQEARGVGSFHGTGPVIAVRTNDVAASVDPTIFGVGGETVGEINRSEGGIVGIAHEVGFRNLKDVALPVGTLVLSHDLPARINLPRSGPVSAGDVNRKELALGGFQEAMYVVPWVCYTTDDDNLAAETPHNVAAIIDCKWLAEYSAGNVDSKELAMFQQESVPSSHRLDGKAVRPHDVTAGIDPQCSGEVSAGDVDRGELSVLASQPAMLSVVNIDVPADHVAGIVDVVSEGVGSAREINRDEDRVSCPSVRGNAHQHEAEGERKKSQWSSHFLSPFSDTSLTRSRKAGAIGPLRPRPSGGLGRVAGKDTLERRPKHRQNIPASRIR
jgi:hypothetical protein